MICCYQKFWNHLSWQLQHGCNVCNIMLWGNSHHQSYVLWMCLYLFLTGWSCYSKSLTILLKWVLHSPTFLLNAKICFEHNSHSRRICCWDEEDDDGNVNQIHREEIHSLLRGAARKNVKVNFLRETWLSLVTSCWTNSQILYVDLDPRFRNTGIPL